jgi:hypothetical protein
VTIADGTRTCVQTYPADRRQPLPQPFYPPARPQPQPSPQAYRNIDECEKANGGHAQARCHCTGIDPGTRLCNSAELDPKN